MHLTKLGPLLLIAGLIIFPPPRLASAQNPSAAQAQQMLQSNPALLQQLRQRILTSGLTPDQVRARLKAEGYPETLLDAYLPGSSASAAETPVPGDDVYSAITRLGIADTADVDLIRCGISADSLVRPDTLPTGASARPQVAQRPARLAHRRGARALAPARCLLAGPKNPR